MKPIISVIVPVYNVEKYIEECLNSILKQDFDEIEVICIDDGSTDQSFDILKRYKRQDDRIVVLHQENCGLSMARNAGLEVARGEYVCFVDSDDMLVPNALRILWNAAVSDKIEIVGYETAPLLFEDEKIKNLGNKDEYYRVNGKYPGIKPGREFFVEMVENNDFVESAWLMFIRMDWLKSVGFIFYPNMLFEDSIFAIQCYFSCKRMKHIKDQLYIYRIRENSIMMEKYRFQHQISRLWQFSECLRAIYIYAQNEREVRALAAYAEQSMVNIKHISYRLDREDREKVSKLDSLYGLLVKSMDIGKEQYNAEISIEGLLAVIRRYSQVILYGAGLVGNKLKRFMENNGLDDRIIGFAVSDMIEERIKDGIAIRYIGCYKPSAENLVIVSARESYHRDMVEKARLLGFQKIYVIDYAMECMIDEKW